MKKDLFDLSIAASGRYAPLLVKKPEYRDLVTFAWSKREPFYNWFYYKEGYSGELVWKLLEGLDLPAGSTVVDPFCGTGTTLLACRQKGFNAVGFDILPLGVFVSNTKLERGYDMDVLYDSIRKVTEKKFGVSSLRWPDLGFIDVKRVFSQYARNDILFFKECIMEIEDEKSRNFLMLALISVVLQASNVKRDGGVLRIVRKKDLPPVRQLFKHKMRRMYRDLRKAEPYPPGFWAEARAGDARNIPLDPESVDACITSPPYLNWVDYTKVYALEMALLMDPGGDLKTWSKRSLRSHVGADERNAAEVSENVRRLLEKVSESGFMKRPQVVEGYFNDMYSVLASLHRVLRKGGKAAFVVSNACLPNVTVDVDTILAELGEDLGYVVEGIAVANVRWCDVSGIRKERPVRESIVVLRK
jgi:SAM-dependent methyltransferase